MTEPFDTQPNPGSPMGNNLPGEPLGIKHPLGMSFIQPKFLKPLGAIPLGGSNVSLFSSNGLVSDRSFNHPFEQTSVVRPIIQNSSDSTHLQEAFGQDSSLEVSHPKFESNSDSLENSQHSSFENQEFGDYNNTFVNDKLSSHIVSSSNESSIQRSEEGFREESLFDSKNILSQQLPANQDFFTSDVVNPISEYTSSTSVTGLQKVAEDQHQVSSESLSDAFTQEKLETEKPTQPENPFTVSASALHENAVEESATAQTSTSSEFLQPSSYQEGSLGTSESNAEIANSTSQTSSSENSTEPQIVQQTRDLQLPESRVVSASTNQVEIEPLTDSESPTLSPTENFEQNLSVQQSSLPSEPTAIAANETSEHHLPQEATQALTHSHIQPSLEDSSKDGLVTSETHSESRNPSVNLSSSQDSVNRSSTLESSDVQDSQVSINSLDSPEQSAPTETLTTQASTAPGAPSDSTSVSLIAAEIPNKNIADTREVKPPEPLETKILQTSTAIDQESTSAEIADPKSSTDTFTEASIANKTGFEESSTDKTSTTVAQEAIEPLEHSSSDSISTKFLEATSLASPTEGVSKEVSTTSPAILQQRSESQNQSHAESISSTIASDQSNAAEPVTSQPSESLDDAVGSYTEEPVVSEASELSSLQTASFPEPISTFHEDGALPTETQRKISSEQQNDSGLSSSSTAFQDSITAEQTLIKSHTNQQSEFNSGGNQNSTEASIANEGVINRSTEVSSAAETTPLQTFSNSESTSNSTPTPHQIQSYTENSEHNFNLPDQQVSSQAFEHASVQTSPNYFQTTTTPTQASLEIQALSDSNPGSQATPISASKPVEFDFKSKEVGGDESLQTQEESFASDVSEELKDTELSQAQEQPSAFGLNADASQAEIPPDLKFNSSTPTDSGEIASIQTASSSESTLDSQSNLSAPFTSVGELPSVEVPSVSTKATTENPSTEQHTSTSSVAEQAQSIDSISDAVFSQATPVDTFSIQTALNSESSLASDSTSEIAIDSNQATQSSVSDNHSTIVPTQLKSNDSVADHESVVNQQNYTPVEGNAKPLIEPLTIKGIAAEPGTTSSFTSSEHDSSEVRSSIQLTTFDSEAAPNSDFGSQTIASSDDANQSHSQIGTFSDSANIQFKNDFIGQVPQFENTSLTEPSVQLKHLSVESSPQSKPVNSFDAPISSSSNSAIEQNALVSLASNQSHRESTTQGSEQITPEPTVAQMLAEGILPQLPTVITHLAPHSPLGTQTSLLPPEQSGSDLSGDAPTIASDSSSFSTERVPIQAFPSENQIPESWSSIEDLLNHSAPARSVGEEGVSPIQSQDFSKPSTEPQRIVQPAVDSTSSENSIHVRASAIEPVQFSLDYGDASFTDSATVSGGMPVVVRGVPVPDAMQGVPGAAEYGNTRLASTVENAIGEILPKQEQKQDTVNLEPLAREIYGLLRQRLEVERERRNGLPYTGRLPW